MNVVSFYRFLDISDPESLRDELQGLCDKQGLLGTILVATEGFNGTIAGREDAIRAVLSWLRDRFDITEDLDARWTDADEAPFRRMRVKVKKEIVTLGRPDILPHRNTGTHVPPERWNGLIEDPNVVVIDTRNHYEFEVGTFPGAIDPGNDSFREFPAFAKILAETSPKRPLAMFCTGGIRCEKATALMLELGFDEVYLLPRVATCNATRAGARSAAQTLNHQTTVKVFPARDASMRPTKTVVPGSKSGASRFCWQKSVVRRI